MQKFRGYCLSVLAGGVLLLPGCEKNTPQEPEQSVEAMATDVDTIINSFKNQQNSSYGTFLAARHAYRNKDLAAATYYLEEGLEFNPTEKGERVPEHLEREYFFTNLYQGNIDALVDQYNQQTTSEEFPVQLIRFTHAVKQANWATAQQALDQISDRLPWKPLFSEWLSYGRDKTINKTVTRQAWNSNFNLGLLQLVNGDHKAAYETFNTITKQQLKAIENNDAEEKPIIHWPVQLLLMQLVAKPEAKETLLKEYREYIPDGFANFLAEKLAGYDQDIVKAAQPETVQQGLATIYLSMATTLQSSNTEVIAVLYYRMADYLLQGQKPLLNTLNQQLLGYNLEEQGFHAQALDAYNKVLPNNLLEPFAIQRKGKVLWAEDKRDAAIDLLTDYLDKHPENAVILRPDLADYLRIEERYGEAIKFYDQLLAEDNNKDNWQFYFARGVAKHQDKDVDWPEAEKDLKKAYDLAPDQPEVLNYLGYSWVEEGQNLEQAEKMILTAIAQRPHDGFMIDSAGWVYYKLGDYKKALRYLKQAVRLEPGDPVINDHYGDALYKADRKREAGFQWQRSLSLDPDSELKQQLEDKLQKLDAQ